MNNNIENFLHNVKFRLGKFICERIDFLVRDVASNSTSADIWYFVIRAYFYVYSQKRANAELSIKELETIFDNYLKKERILSAVNRESYLRLYLIPIEERPHVRYSSSLMKEMEEDYICDWFEKYEKGIDNLYIPNVASSYSLL